jgi:uncharacterized protein (TIGR03000 family)
MYSVVLMMALTGSADVPACHRSCHGCYGGGCFGGGCHGGRGGHGCHGGYGCNGGGCYGGGYGCYGGGYAYGCYGGGYGGCYGGGYGGCYGGGMIMAPAGTAPKMEGGKKPEGIKAPTPGTPKPEAFLPTPATIVVSLPAEAKLTIDGAATKSTSATRVFASPALEPGKEFVYNLKAELVRDGQTLTATKQVTVRAGDETNVTLEFPEASLALR